MIRALVALGLALWLLGLGFALQPQHTSPPRITHAHPLDVADHDLPTLAPLPH